MVTSEGSLDAQKIELQLSRSEALVLFEWLTRESDPDLTTLKFEDPIEERVLWRLEGKLEKALLVEILDPDYRELLAKARDRVRENL
jgi:hypothetical protein